MTWSSHLLPGVDVAPVVQLVKDWRFTDEGHAQGAAVAILEAAAQCRLAFTYVSGLEGYEEVHGDSPMEALVSRTSLRPRRGRPNSTRWLYWLCYYVRAQLAERPSKRLTTRQLAAMVKIVSGQTVPVDRLRAALLDVKKEAEQRAVAGSRVLLDNVLRRKLSDLEFASQMRTPLIGMDIATQAPPMIVNGRINEPWLERIIAVRRAILAAIFDAGPLAGEPPYLEFVGIAMLREGIPLTPPSRVGTAHLDKGVNAIAPLPRSAPSSIRVELDVSSLPYAVGLYSIPRWLREWRMAWDMPIGAIRARTV